MFRSPFEPLRCVVASPPARRTLWLGLALGLALVLLFGGAASAVQGQRTSPAIPGAPLLPPQSAQSGHPQPDGRAAPIPPTRLAHVPAASTDPNWTNVFPPLFRVSAAAPTEAWAVGAGPGQLWHYSASAWSIVTPTVLSGLTASDIQFLTPTDGWLTARGASGSRALHYDGTTWTDRSAGLGPTLGIAWLAVRNDTDIWATGQMCPTPSTCQTTLVHWDGTAWSPSGSAFASGIYLYAIALAGATEGWAVGIDSSGPSSVPLAIHYNGSSWTRLPGPVNTQYLSRVAVVPTGEAWAVGMDSSYNAQLYHYSGGTWTLQPTPDGSAPQDLYFLSATQGWAATSLGVLAWNGTQWAVAYAGRWLDAVAAVAGRVWAVGEAETIVGQSGSNPWLVEYGGPTTNDLLGVATVSPDEAWAVGANGTFLHYLGGTWQPVTTPFTGTIWAVQMISATEGYAVGDDLIAHWDGSTWSRVAQPFGGPGGLYALALTGLGEGWAVGSHGVIWHATGGVWAQWPEQPVRQFLLGIAMDSPTHGWAVGGTTAGKVLEYTGGSWVDRSSTLPPGVPTLQGVITGPGPDEAWAGVWANNDTSAPALLHYQGGTWSWVPGVTGLAITAFAHEALGELWAMGGFPVYHYSSSAWQAVSLPADIWPLQSMALVPGRGGWAVGYAGQILRYNPLAPGQRYYDVPLSNPFASYIEYMAVHNIVSGYADNTFHPYAEITRGQLTKMVVQGLGWAVVTPVSPTFADVPVTHPFYSFIETAASHGVISGYACGGPGEPCDGQQRPYFRPQANVTRAQLTKIIVGAKGWGVLTPPTPTFSDVPASQPFYGFIEQAAARGIISGYSCGGPGEPCPGAYFRPGNTATRGQLSKILYLALTQP